MQFIPGANNNLKIKSLYRSDDGHIILGATMNNQEETFDLSELLDDTEYETVLNKIENVFENIFPKLINKILN